jgi:hypothetical protein
VAYSLLVRHRHKSVQPLCVRVRSHNRAEEVNGKSAYGLLARKNDRKDRGKLFPLIGRFAGFRVESDVRSILAAANHVAVAVDALGLSKRALRRQPVKITAPDDEAADIAEVDRSSRDPASIGDAIEPRGARRTRRVFYADLVKRAILPREGIVIHRAHYFQRVVNAAWDRSFKSSWEVQSPKRAVAQAQEAMQLEVTGQSEKADNIAVVVNPVHKGVCSAREVDGCEMLIGQLVAVGGMTVDRVGPDNAAEVVDARGVRGHGAGKTDFYEIKSRLGLSKACAAQSNADQQKTSNFTMHGKPQWVLPQASSSEGNTWIDAANRFGERLHQHSAWKHTFSGAAFVKMSW